MNYLATFHTHYGAMRFHKHCKKENIEAKMAPVPRELSSSCGVCVYFQADNAPREQEHEDMEHCYTITPGGGYIQQQGGETDEQ